ncbi:zinc finger protein 3 homolog isoform X4 [Periplaneta americana]|uniref:zinc finger protein 3 homolog isoform X4 n=1 Tax=Periplaneta americana TaxID=6978 RepID=UPI0037E8DB36
MEQKINRCGQGENIYEDVKRKKFYNVKNMDIVKVEPDEEEPVKGWLPPVKPEPQDPLDVNDERRESWGWNLNVIDSSSKHTQAKNEDLPWNAPEVKEELTIEDYELKLPGTKHVADNINTVTLKVEADEESVKIQLPPVKTEFQDPLDVTDEGVVPWKWNLNVTDSSFVHKQMKVENLPQKESLLNKETNEELTVDSRQTKPSNYSNRNAEENSEGATSQSTEGESEVEYSYLKLIKSIKCKYCYKIFKEGNELEEHLRTHSREKPYKCETCGKEFGKRGTLTRHIRSHTGDKPFKCDHCGKCFIALNILIRHVRIHTGEKPYKCEQCGKCFNRRSTLTKHVNSHTKGKSFKCSSCELRFTNRHDLYRHAPTHTEGKLFKCDTCGKEFNLQAFLIRHLRTHTWKKAYKCKFCEKHFKQLTRFRNHLDIHLGRKQFTDDHCQKNFTEEQIIPHEETHEVEMPVGAGITSTADIPAVLK